MSATSTGPASSLIDPSWLSTRQPIGRSPERSRRHPVPGRPGARPALRPSAGLGLLDQRPEPFERCAVGASRSETPARSSISMPSKMLATSGRVSRATSAARAVARRPSWCRPTRASRASRPLPRATGRPARDQRGRPSTAPTALARSPTPRRRRGGGRRCAISPTARPARRRGVAGARAAARSGARAPRPAAAACRRSDSARATAACPPARRPPGCWCRRSALDEGSRAASRMRSRVVSPRTARPSTLLDTRLAYQYIGRSIDQLFPEGCRCRTSTSS